MKIDVLLGLQWGDEGKGKVVDVLTPSYDMIARFQGGPMQVTPSYSVERSSFCIPFLRGFSRTRQKTLWATE